MDGFVNSHTGQLEDTGSLSYAAIPDVVTFHYTISEKNHLISFLMLMVIHPNFPKI